MNPHLFLRGEYAEFCQVCQLPERNTRVHPDPAELPTVPDHTEPVHQHHLQGVLIAA